jgi:hypothetical protein
MGAIQPTKNHKLIIDEFIRYAQQHLNTVSGIVNTVSTYPPLNTPGPGIINWSGYSVQPANFSGLTSDEFFEEAEAIERDINEEYPANQKLYEEQFETEEAAMENNSDVTEESAFFRVNQYNDEKEFGVDPVTDPQIIQPQPAPTPYEPPPAAAPDVDLQEKKVAGPVGRGDEALFRKCGNGVWPALGTAPSFQVSSTQPGKCTRYWYKVNTEYMTKNCTQIMFPTSSGDKKITVHKDLAAIVKPAIVKIKALGLQKYIENCGGGLAVRNVTCGTRLSNHSWGTAIDMNTTKYPYGYKFKPDGIYVGAKKLRDLDAFDRGFQQVAAIFKSQGMTWLSNNDPMHVSIYE